MITFLDLILCAVGWSIGVYLSSATASHYDVLFFAAIVCLLEYLWQRIIA